MIKVFKMTDENKDTLVSAMTYLYKSEGCGICEKKGAEVFWFSPFSRCAHAKCVKTIKKTESRLTKSIDLLFKNEKDYRHHNNAHIMAVKAVRQACGSDTILTYLEKNDEYALAHLFNTVGTEAVVRYVLRKNPEPKL